MEMTGYSTPTPDHKEVEVIKTQASVVVTQAAGCTHTDLDLRFRDVISEHEQNRFRRTIQRKSGCVEVDDEIVTLCDVKDVVLFTVMSKLPAEFIDMMYTLEADYFFRALIFYFQLFLQTYDDLVVRNAISKRKVRQPATIEVENVMRDNLADLRSMVSREYCFILLGMGKVAKYHHMGNRLQASAPERDIRLFELLMRIAVRIVWVALERRSLNLIEHEVGRLFRSEEFNLAARRARLSASITPIEKRVLYRKETDEACRLLTKSPLALELIKYRHDFRLLGTGYMKFESSDKRIKFFEDAYTTPEETLSSVEIPFGVLGKPRSNFDAMLVPLGTHEVNEVDLNRDAIPLHHGSTLTDMKQYSMVCVPVGDIDTAEIVPIDFPTEKGAFVTNSNTTNLDEARILWRTLRAISESRHNK